MQSQRPACPICHLEFDKAERLPKIVPTCGHKICSSCFNNISVQNVTACPLDKRPFSRGKKSIDPTKTIMPPLRQNTEERLGQDTCGHQKNLTFICFTDKCRVCDDCAVLGSHKSHDIRLLKDIQPKLDSKKRELEVALDSLDKHSQEIDNIFEQSRTSVAKSIKNRFEEFVWMLWMKEADLIQESNAYFDLQKKEAQSTLGVDSDLRKEITKRISGFQNPSGGIVDLLAEDIFPLVSKFKAQSLNTTAQKLNQNMNQVLEMFNTSLMSQKQQLSHIELPIQEFSKASESYSGAHRQGSKVNISQPQVKTHLQLERNNDCLDIIIQEGSPQETVINFDELKKLRR